MNYIGPLRFKASVHRVSNEGIIVNSQDKGFGASRETVLS